MIQKSGLPHILSQRYKHIEARRYTSVANPVMWRKIECMAWAPHVRYVGYAGVQFM
jgi:hypothetical protein